MSDLRHLQSHVRGVRQAYRLNWSNLGLEAKYFFLFPELQSMLQFQIFLIYLKCEADHIQADQVHVPQPLREQVLGLCPSSCIYWLRELCCPQPTPIHQPFYFQPSPYFTSTESSGSLISFYYCLVWYILSFIIFPNSRSWKDCRFVHYWKHNANFLQGLWGLTSILNDKAVC